MLDALSAPYGRPVSWAIVATTRGMLIVYVIVFALLQGVRYAVSRCDSLSAGAVLSTALVHNRSTRTVLVFSFRRDLLSLSERWCTL
jgi:hypothetical protein